MISFGGQIKGGGDAFTWGLNEWFCVEPSANEAAEGDFNRTTFFKTPEQQHCTLTQQLKDEAALAERYRTSLFMPPPPPFTPLTSFTKDVAYL